MSSLRSEQGLNAGGLQCAAELAVNGEVVMCAGSIHTPQIMQLSGFGPRDQLSEMGVDVKADMPGVGQNMIVSAPMCTCSGSH